MKFFLIPLLGLGLAVCAASLRAQEQEAAAAVQEEAPKPKPKKKAKGKVYDYDKSKYKAYRVNPAPSVYRFDASGKPILPQEKKTPAKKKPMTTSQEEDCGSEDSCKDAQDE